VIVEALAAAAISLVAPYLAKGADSFAQEAGSQAAVSVRALVDRLRRWWSGEPVAAAAAEELVSDPKKYSPILGQLLTAELAHDAAFATELRSLVDAVGPHVEVVQRIELADGVTGASIGELVRGTVRVEQQIQEAHDVVGVEADRIGG
jgi:hypothetical protein